MMDLEELERSLLQGARKGLGPAASDRMRVQSRMVSNAAWWQPAPARPSVWRRFTGSWRGGLLLGFGVGALLGFGASHGLEHAANERALADDAGLAVAAVRSPVRPELATRALLGDAEPAGTEEAAAEETSAEEDVQLAGPSLELAREKSAARRERTGTPRAARPWRRSWLYCSAHDARSTATTRSWRSASCSRWTSAFPTAY